jgi:ABC-2 type transport system permease protein
VRQALGTASIYLRIAAMWPQIAYVYRLNLAVRLVGVLLQILLLKVVWTSIYGNQTSVAGVQLHTLVTYLTLSNLQLWLMFPFVAGLLQERVYRGTVALDLARPVGFIGQMLAQQCGTTAGLIPLLALAFPFALFAGGMQFPASPTAALCYLVSLLLAYMVTVLLGMLIGLVAFWTIRFGGLIGIYLFAGQFFSGALVPLRFFPPHLRSVASALPFQAQAGLPVSIYLGQSAAAGSLAIQLFWVLLLSAAVGIFWRKTIQRVVILGG